MTKQEEMKEGIIIRWRKPNQGWLYFRYRRFRVFFGKYWQWQIMKTASDLYIELGIIHIRISLSHWG